MPDSPLISVIVPVYNTEKYLRKCLDSICGQTYRNLEILCVNDGSPDGSADILEEYAARDARIRVFHQPNAGQSAARNLALDNARGEWVTGVDSDDYLEPDAYEYAVSSVADEVDIVCFGVNIIWDGVEVDEPYERSFAQRFNGKFVPTPEIIAETHVVFWNKLWRRSFVEQYNCRFPVGLWYEDMFFWRALAPFARNIAYLPAGKINYVRQPGSIMCNSGTVNPKTLDHVQIIDKLLAFYEKNTLPFSDGILEVFLFSYQCAAVDVAPELHPKLAEGYKHVAQKYGLTTRYNSALRFLTPASPFLQLFSKHRPGKSSYGFLGFQLVKIQYKYGRRVRRILGIKI